MGAVRRLRIRNYRSIRDWVDITFPRDGPLILVGENNAGKSNIVRALELVLGESWPGSYEPEDHDFHNRDRNNAPLEVIVDVEGVAHTDVYGRTRQVSQFHLRHPPDDGRPFYMAFDDGQESPYVSNAIREQCPCIVVGADRRLSYQLSYASRFTFLSKLMRRFHDALTREQALVGELQGKFEEVKRLFERVERFRVFAEELERQVGELSANLEYRLGIDFSAYDPSRFFHALRVLPHENSEVRTFEELGTGQEQILALAFAHAYARAFHGEGGGLVLVIEEPEAHLHPLAQEWVGQQVHELAREDVQVVITTHSAAFLDLLNLQGFVLVRKRRNATEVIQLTKERLAEHCQEKGATKAAADTVLPFYAAAATKEILAGLFARKVVLVEGPSEALALPLYLARAGLDPTREGIAIIPVHGVGNLAKWWRFFTAFGIPVYVAFDNDSSGDSNGNKRRELLATLGMPASRHDGLLRTTDWIIEEGCSVFGGNFEETMRAVFGAAYEQLEEEAENQYGLSPGQSKPLVARYVAGKLMHDEQNDGWRCVSKLAKAIRQLQ